MARRIPPPDPEAERGLCNLRLSFMPKLDEVPTAVTFQSSHLASRDAVLAMTLGTPEAWIAVSRNMTAWMEYWSRWHPSASVRARIARELEDPEAEEVEEFLQRRTGS